MKPRKDIKTLKKEVKEMKERTKKEEEYERVRKEHNDLRFSNSRLGGFVGKLGGRMEHISKGLGKIQSNGILRGINEKHQKSLSKGYGIKFNPNWAG
jgi:hypothetical protein